MRDQGCMCGRGGGRTISLYENHLLFSAFSHIHVPFLICGSMRIKACFKANTILLYDHTDISGTTVLQQILLLLSSHDCFNTNFFIATRICCFFTTAMQFRDKLERFALKTSQQDLSQQWFNFNLTHDKQQCTLSFKFPLSHQSVHSNYCTKLTYTQQNMDSSKRFSMWLQIV